MRFQIYFYDRAPRTAFIHKFMPERSLGQLRLGEKTYLQNMLAILPSTASIRLLSRVAPVTEIAMLCEIRTEANNVLPNDGVIIIDMTRYPVAPEFLQHFLSKALQCPDIPLRIMGPGITACPTWFICSGNYLTHGDAEETASVNAETDFLDLHNPEAAMRLFSGSLVTRAFNTLNVAPNGYFVKKSSNISKMKAEYAFLSKGYASLRQYLPQVGAYVESAHTAEYEIEIIPTLDVAKSLLNCNFSDETVCMRFFEKVEHYFASCPRKSVTPEQYRQSARAAFVHKTQRRVEMTLALPFLPKLDALAQLGDWPDYKHFATAFLEHLEEDIAKYAESTLVFSHGDLFFGNMLFDIHTGVLKLIDPRGLQENNADAAYLPAFYDLAKLSHSIYGLYDSIIYRLMDINFDNTGRPILHPREMLSGTAFLQHCFSQMLQRLRISEARVRLYEGSLFLSMLPLHAEDYSRVAQLLVRAMELIPQKGH